MSIANIRGIGPALVLVSATILGGCGGFHIYDKERDTAAASVAAKNDAVQVTQLFDDIRGNLDTLRTAEAQVHQDLFEHLTRRKVFEILRTDLDNAQNSRPAVPFSDWIDPFSTAVISDEDFLDQLNETSGKAIPYVAMRMTALGIANEEDLKSAVLAHSRLVSSASLSNTFLTGALKTQVGFLKSVLKWDSKVMPIPSCPEAVGMNADAPFTGSPPAVRTFTDGTGVDRATAKGIFKTYQSACADMLNSSFGKILKVKGEIGGAYQAFTAATARVADIYASIQAMRDKTDALKARTDAATTTDPVAGLQTEAGEILELVKDTNRTAERLGLSLQLSKERIAAISAVIEAFRSGTPTEIDEDTIAALGDDAPRVRKAVIVAAGLPALGMNIKNLQDALNRPAGREGLLIQLGQEELRLSLLEALVQIENEKAAAAKQRLQALLDEARRYYKAYDALTQHAGSLKDDSLSAIVTSNAQGRDKIMAMRSIRLFIQAQSLSRTQAVVQELAAFDLEHRKSVLINEYAVRAWKALIDGPMAQIAAYWDGGVKPETIADLAVGIGQIVTFGLIAVEATDD